MIQTMTRWHMLPELVLLAFFKAKVPTENEVNIFSAFLAAAGASFSSLTSQLQDLCYLAFIQVA